MIKINLLPEEYRRSERTSPKVFAAALVGVILVCSGFGWFGMIYFGELSKARKQHQEVSAQLKVDEQKAAYHDQLVKEKKEFSKRADTIRDIARGRKLWTKTMDGFIDLITNDGAADRHEAWFSNVQIRGSRDGRKGPTMILPGRVAGGDLQKMANLFDDLKAADWFRDVGMISKPEATREVTPNVVPEEALIFPLTMEFRPPAQWVKNRVGAKPGK